MSDAPERIWMDPDIKFPECEKQYGNDVEYVRADRIEELEAKLAVAVTHFKKLRRRQDSIETFDAVVNEIVEAALAELTGGKDE